MKYYTYLWLREDGTPYYVGKGCGRRAFRKGSPKNSSRIILEHHPTEHEALEAEIFLIAIYGRQDDGTGTLRNKTYGGDAPPLGSHKGHLHSQEAKQKMRLAKLGKKLGPYSDEHRQRIAQGNTGKVRSIASRQKQSMSCSGRASWNLGRSCPHPANVVWTSEMREAARQRAQGNTNRRGATLSEETRLKISSSKRHAAKAGA